MEIYKDVIGFEGYEVSNFGNVRTKEGKTTTRKDGLKRIWKQRVLKYQINTKGYKIVKVFKEGVSYTRTIHRLEMLAFYPEGEADTVNHIDGNKLNNNLNNLEWASYSENTVHAFETGLNQSSMKIRLSKSNHEYSFISLQKASLWLGRNHGYISAQLKKGAKTVEGYKITLL